MRELAMAWGLGALSGSRSMLGPAVVARSALPLPARRVLSLLAAGELAADKSPRIPARTSALPLAGRIVMGAAAAATFAKRKRLQAALAGAAGALASTYACFYLRRFATNQLRIPNVVAGVVEDAAALSAGTMLMRARR